MGWLERCFADLPDTRVGNAKRHDLMEVVTMALVASICRAESCVDFADFARDREWQDAAPLLRPCRGGIPLHVVTAFAC
jgi:hypothetical protein